LKKTTRPLLVIRAGVVGSSDAVSVAHRLVEHADGDHVITVIVEDKEMVGFYFMDTAKPLPTFGEENLAKMVEEHRHGPIPDRAAMDTKKDLVGHLIHHHREPLGELDHVHVHAPVDGDAELEPIDGLGVMP
jgi:hypothetical protein